MKLQHLVFTKTFQKKFPEMWNFRKKISQNFALFLHFLLHSFSQKSLRDTKENFHIFRISPPGAQLGAVGLGPPPMRSAPVYQLCIICICVENTLQLNKVFKVFFGNVNASKICGTASKKIEETPLLKSFKFF